MENLQVIVIGAGGHAKVVIDALKALNIQILGATDVDSKTHGQHILGIPILGNDDIIFQHGNNSVVLVNGIGSTRVSGDRQTIHNKFHGAGFSFRTIVHPSAIIGGGVKISDGVQILAGAVIQPECKIGANTIINFRASLAHDCDVGAEVHIAPCAGLSGGVKVGEGSFIGAGATVVQYINIGDGALIAAGATVISDVPANGRVAGVPARDM